MKIRLIEPSRYIAVGKLLKSKQLLFPSLTLPFLAALTPQDVEVSITSEQFCDIDFEEKLDFVGITSYTQEIFRAYEVADEFRKRGVHVVMGGIHVSLEHQEALQHADTVIVGEAEDTWPEFIRDFKMGIPQKLYLATRRPTLENLPVPRFSLLDRSRYLSYQTKGLYRFLPFPMISVQTARGCPHACDFCCVTTFFGGEYRARPVLEVINEIKALKAKTCFFVDDNIFALPRRAEELFEALIPLKIRWLGQATIGAAKNKSLMRLAQKSGCIAVGIGLESLSRSALESMGKKINQVEEYENNLTAYRKHGIATAIHMIFGFDHDEPKAFHEAYKFLLKNSIPYTFWWPLTPLPGTRFIKKLESQGRLKSDKWWLSPVRAFELKFTKSKIDDESFSKNFLYYYSRFYSLGNIIRRILFPPQKRLITKFLLNLVMKEKTSQVRTGGNLA